MKTIIAASCALPLLLSACVSSYPREVDASNPTVTYRYRGDRELLEANQNAAAFCYQYNAQPRTLHIEETSGGREVTFECVRASGTGY